MEEKDRVDFIKKKSLLGIFSLLQRQILVRILFFAGNLVLARILVPQDFGAYAIIVFAMQFFSVFGDVGLGAALIQLKREPTCEETATTFWIQQALVGVFVSTVFILSPYLPHFFPSLPADVAWMARVLCAGFVFASLRSLPVVLMERRLDFTRIARVEIAEQIVFFASAIGLASGGWGVWSFVIATLVKEAVGSFLVYWATRWHPSFLFRLDALRGLLRFGIPYQGNNVLNFIKEGVTPLFVGAYCGATGVGFLSWARTLAFAPLFLSESFGRVAFPAYSAIHDNRALLGESVEKSIRMLTFLLLPLTLLLVVCAPEITMIFFTEKWLPGLGAFYLYCTTPLLIGVMLPMYSAILSLGRSSILLKMSLLLVVLEWGLGVPFVLAFGYTGIAVNQPIITGIYFFVYRHVLRGERISLAIFPNVWRQFISAVLSGGLVWVLLDLFPVGLVSLVACFLSGVVVYAVLMLGVGSKIITEFGEQLSVIFRRNDP